jgi:hypothetical protein
MRITSACYLRRQGFVEVQPSIRLAVTAALSRKDCERVSVVIKAAVAKVLARRIKSPCCPHIDCGAFTVIRLHYIIHYSPYREPAPSRWIISITVNICAKLGSSYAVETCPGVRLRYMGVVAPYLRKAWTRDLTASCEGMSIMISHMAAAVVSRRCGDLTVVGRAAATFSVGGSRPKVSAWSAGGNLTQFDADAYALARTVEEITHTYTDEVPPLDNIFIFSNLASALQAVQNPRSIKAHSSALRFHCALTTLTLCHSYVSFYLIWSPAVTLR